MVNLMKNLNVGASKYTGSSNQRIIDVGRSILDDKIILWGK